jgi:hypothetical protein
MRFMRGERTQHVGRTQLLIEKVTKILAGDVKGHRLTGTAEPTSGRPVDLQSTGGCIADAKDNSLLRLDLRGLPDVCQTGDRWPSVRCGRKPTGAARLNIQPQLEAGRSSSAIGYATSVY